MYFPPLRRVLFEASLLVLLMLMFSIGLVFKKGSLDVGALAVVIFYFIFLFCAAEFALGIFAKPPDPAEKAKLKFFSDLAGCLNRALESPGVKSQIRAMAQGGVEFAPGIGGREGAAEFICGFVSTGVALELAGIRKPNAGEGAFAKVFRLEEKRERMAEQLAFRLAEEFEKTAIANKGDVDKSFARFKSALGGRFDKEYEKICIEDFPKCMGFASVTHRLAGKLP